MTKNYRSKLKECVEEWRWLPLLFLCWCVIAAVFNPILDGPSTLIAVYVLTGSTSALVLWTA